jgi:hypothetical protein
MKSAREARIRPHPPIAALIASVALALGFSAQGAGPEVISHDVRSPEGPIFVDAVLYLVEDDETGQRLREPNAAFCCSTSLPMHR